MNKMTKMHLIGAAAVAAAIVSGCSNSQPDTVAVSVNGNKLMRSEITQRIEEEIKQYGDKIPAEQLEGAKLFAAKQYAIAFIQKTAIQDKAVELGYKVEESDYAEFAAKLAANPNPSGPKTIEELLANSGMPADKAKAEFEANMLANKMIKAEVVDKVGGDFAAEAKELISKNEAAQTKINEIKAKLDTVPAEELEAKFAEIASAESDCPSKEKGGDLGEFTKGKMVPEFNDAAFSAEVGKVVGPVKTKFGYHLIMVTKKTPAVEAADGKDAVPESVQARHILVRSSELPPEEEIVKALKGKAVREAVEKFVLETIQKANIEGYDEFAEVVGEIKGAAKDAEAQPQEATTEK